MARSKENNYFEMFVQGVSYACDAAAILQEDLTSYRPETMYDQLAALHKVEHSADIAKHELMSKLLKEFITPIDREDIIDLANAIDDVTDSIEDVLERIYMFNVLELQEEALPFAGLIVQCCVSLKALMEEFENFRKSRTMVEHITSLNHLEEEGDKLYIQAMRRLHSEPHDPCTRQVWTVLYDQLEKCCDRCEDVADVVERIILKCS